MRVAFEQCTVHERLLPGPPDRLWRISFVIRSCNPADIRPRLSDSSFQFPPQRKLNELTLATPAGWLRSEDADLFLLALPVAA
jgi:hypothetical protein